MKIIFVIATFLICNSSFADEISGFKNYELSKTTLSDVQASSGFLEKASGYYCYTTPDEISDQTCSSPETIANVPAKLTLYFYNEKLEAISLRTAEVRFSEIVSALIEKYGRPNEEVNDVSKNRAGATFDNKKLLWKKGQAFIEAKQRAGTVDKCSITFASSGWNDKVAERLKEFAKKKSKDL